MLSKLSDFVKSHFSDIILIIVVVLLVMLAFAAGFLSAKSYSKTPIQIENTNTSN